MITRALPEHAGVLTAIAVEAKRHWKYPEKWIQIWLPSLTITPGYITTHEVWMAAVGGQPVGYYSFEENVDELGLDNLWVLPDYMGRGIGKALFEHALERCKARNVSLLKIEADPNAQGFYERMGARKVDELHTQVDGKPRILPVMEIRV